MPDVERTPVNSSDLLRILENICTANNLSIGRKDRGELMVDRKAMVIMADCLHRRGIHHVERTARVQRKTRTAIQQARATGG